MKSSLELFFPLAKEPARFNVVLHIDKNSGKIVAVEMTFVLPGSADDLGLLSDGAELPAQLQERLPNQFVGHRFAVIEPERQQDFVATQAVHTEPDRSL